MATTGPQTSLHYAANGNFVGGVYAPAVDGFNLADVSSAAQLSSLPAGVKGLVYLGMTSGVTAAFTAAVDACIGNPKLYGFYLADEPDQSATTAANLKAEADYIRAHVPGAISFMAEQNLSSNTSPVYYYTPANTHIDLYGLDPYPVQTNVPGNLDYGIIPLAVAEALKVGIPLADIVPVYQAFGGGGYTTYILPTPAQELQILATWASVVPTPAFDYAYSWGTQLGDTALSNDPALAAIFAAHNAGGGVGGSAPTVTITSVGGTTTLASQTVTGTVDLADAGSTVSIFDGTKLIGTATVSVTGTWSDVVTLSVTGANVLTATDTNAYGTGTSNAVTYTLTPTESPRAPTVTIANSSLAVTGRGGTVKLGISETAPLSATNVTLTIKGLPSYETIADGLGDVFRGRSITMTEAQVNSGLTLTSNYTGNYDRITKLTITGSDTMGGVRKTSAIQTLSVDALPPAAAKVALLSQYIASGFEGGSGGAPLTSNSAPSLANSDTYLATPQHA